MRKNCNFASFLRNRWQDEEFPVYVARNINTLRYHTKWQI